MWCMKEQRNVHLGYWIAQTCNSMAIRASRHLNICHILGALFKNCFDMSIEKGIPRLTYCPRPELFNTNFFVNVNIMTWKGWRLFFYKVIKPKVAKTTAVEKETRSQTEAVTPTTHALIETAAPETHTKLAEHVEEWSTRMERLVERLTQNDNEQKEISAAQTEHMRRAVETMEQMAIMVTRHLIPPRQATHQSTPQGPGSRQPLDIERQDPEFADPIRSQTKK